MSTSPLTPTEALLHVAKSRPYFPAVRSGNTHWSYAALWNRIRQLSGHIDYLVEAGLPVGLYTK
ncbi:hypothetical protein OBBRIDRAFT_723741 [Obba rivulosa]|uniref:Uncharacterized protein n=1 Tax=Obba rivulosa TaxID=1052685 RepID=A0A8E2DQM9_9APHY|nr:hypothetical protein OBBRIDRAFT_723741 [Obba rivulosa]